MEMSGEYRIEAPREKVWAALNDPEILKQSIPGCEEIEQTSDTSFEAQVTAKVGPVKAKFSGAVELTDIDAPNGYRISGEGKGGAAGFAKGGANVRLEEDGDGTLLKYDVDAQVGGKLAQLGARLIDGTAKKMASQFFENFAEAVEGGGAAASVEDESEDSGEETDSPSPPPAESAPAAGGASEATAMAQIGAGTWIGAAVIVALVVIALAA